jgi:hypothetical protein
MKAQLQSCLLALATIGISACVTQPPLVTQCSATMSGDRRGGPALVGHEYGPQTTPIPLNSVQFADVSLSHRLAVQNLFAKRTPAETVAVSARFISCADTDLTIRVRTSFLAADESAAEAPSEWRTVFLHPHLTSAYAENSTSRDVANYLIEIMPE